MAIDEFVVNDFSSLQDYLIAEKGKGTINRLGRLFHTKRNNYFYDSGTGKVLRLDDKFYVVFRDLFSNYYTVANAKESLAWLPDEKKDELVATVNQEKILMRPRLTDMCTSDMFQLSKNRLTQLILEITEKCNFRCKYCIYSDHYDLNRSFGVKDMSWEIAQKALDFGLSHSQDIFSITFYGGEPLANFPLLKQCINYSLEHANGKQLLFSFTSNLSLLTPEMADFFGTVPHLSVLVSLDGPEKIHNQARVYRNGDGTYNDVMRGLTLLANAFKGTDNTIQTNTVLIPPYDFEKLDKLNSFFENLSILPPACRCQSTYTTYGSFPYAQDYVQKEIRNNPKYDFNGINDAVLKWEALKMEDQGITNERNLYSVEITSILNRINRRMISNTPTNAIGLNGNCIPGQRRLFISVEGKFKLCERIENSPTIGDVNNGFDDESIIKHYIVDYAQKSLPYCDQCWAYNLCNICYAGHYNENGLDIKRKNRSCNSARAVTEYALSLYHELMEESPDKLKFLKDVVVG